MLGIEILEQSEKEKYTGAIYGCSMASFWREGKLLNVMSPDDVLWVTQRLLNAGLISDKFSKALSSQKKELSFRLFPQVSAQDLREVFINRALHNAFVFAISSGEWTYKDIVPRLKVLRSFSTENLLQNIHSQRDAIEKMFWHVSSLWVRIIDPVHALLERESSVIPLRQLIIDSTIEESQLLMYIQEWERGGAIQVSDRPAAIVAELTEHEKLLFTDYDRFRSPQIQPPIKTEEEEEIIIGEEYSLSFLELIQDTNTLLKHFSPPFLFSHELLRISHQDCMINEDKAKQLEEASFDDLTQRLKSVLDGAQSIQSSRIPKRLLMSWESRWLS
jgi:hypothetical protein